MDFSAKEIERYIENHTSKEEPLLAELERETNLKVIQPRMISGKVQGRFLQMIVRILRPRHILEIGTFTGYSTLWMASGLVEAGIIDTVEIDDELNSISSSFITRSTHSAKVVQHIGSALEIVPSLGRVFDLVFIDGDKREYPDYYRMLMGDAPYINKCVDSGTYIIADNILWYGKVAFDAPASDRHTTALKRFNEIVSNDERVENVILPVRDGLNIIRVL